MPRIDPRVLVLAPVIMLAGACSGDAGTPAPAPAAPSSPAAAPPSPAASAPEPSDSVFVEEDEEPSAAPGDLSGEAQSYLDEALGIELGALEQAPAEAAADRRKVLDALPDNPSAVLTALKNYPWYSPEARAAYDRAVAAG